MSEYPRFCVIANSRPSLELGVRHDGGDAETGAGLELGGGVSYADPATRLSVEARARMLRRTRTRTTRSEA